MVRTNRLFILLAFAALLLPAKSARGQAWVRDTDSYFFKLSASYLFATEEYNHEGDTQPILEDFTGRSDSWFRDVTIQSYLEYGVTKDLTLVMELPFKILTTRVIETLDDGVTERESKRQNGGLADLRLQLRYPLFRSNVLVSSLQGGVKIPMGYEKTPDNGGAPLGTGEFDFEAGPFVGISLYPIPAYLSGGVGYRVRGGPLHDEFLYTGEVGGTIKNRVFAKLRLEGAENTHTPPDLSTAGNNVIVGDQDWLKLMPLVSLRLAEGTWLTVEAFHVLRGKNTVAGTTYQAAIAFVR